MIMIGSLLSIAMELVIGPDRHTPFDPDGTIPSNHLHNFEHSFISAGLFIYALFSILLDKIKTKAQDSLTQLLGALAFGQMFLLFHIHSADHMGVEGQYHWLLQIVVFIAFLSTLLGIGYPKSFAIGFTRSFSILFTGVWFMVMGFMLWVPSFIAKGCYINLEEGHKVVRCHSHEALERAKSLVNIQFSEYLIFVTIFSMCLYLFLVKVYGEKVEYQSLNYEEKEEGIEDIEAQKQTKHIARNSFLDHMEKSFATMELER